MTAAVAHSPAAHRKTIAIAGGGTGGHVLPALALADAWKAEVPDADVFFLGTAHGMEARLVPARGWELELVSGSRLVGGSLAGKVKGLQGLVSGVRQARRILRSRGADLVLGVGGYASGAALLAARSLGLPSAIHESNAVPGLTNRVLGQMVDRVYLGFAAAQDDFPRDVSVTSGNPVRAAIAAVGPQRQPRSGQRPARVLIVGGSQGSEFLNARVPPLLAALAAQGISLEIRHQVGKLPPEPVAQTYAHLGLQAEILGFIDDMAAAYAWADFAITRSGSGTVSELAAAALPALLVPFPFAAGDHQAANAKAFADAGCGHWVRQGDWKEAELVEKLAILLTRPSAWQAASAAALRFATPDAARDVVRDCLQWMEGRW